MALNKKRDRKRQKNTKSLLDKYKDDIFKDINIQDKSSMNLLIKTKKIKNQKKGTAKDISEVFEK